MGLKQLRVNLMYREDILRMTRAIPFQPFQLTLSNGERFVVRHPDMIVPTLGAAFIGLPGKAGKEDRADDGVFVSLAHIVKIEVLPAGTNPAVAGLSA